MAWQPAHDTRGVSAELVARERPMVRFSALFAHLHSVGAGYAPCGRLPCSAAPLGPPHPGYPGPRPCGGPGAGSCSGPGCVMAGGGPRVSTPCTQRSQRSLPALAGCGDGLIARTARGREMAWAERLFATICGEGSPCGAAGTAAQREVGEGEAPIRIKGNGPESLSSLRRGARAVIAATPVARWTGARRR